MALILVVDDEVSLRTNLKVFLELNGHTIEMAVDGVDGLEKAAQINPDLIVSDVMMPRMDGYTMLKELKFTPALENIPVIMLTAKDGLSDLCEIEGAIEFLLKPFDFNALLEIVNKYVQ